MLLLWLLLILLFILSFILFSLFLRVRIKIDYHHKNRDDHLIVSVQTLFGLIKYKKEIPMIKIAEDSPAFVYEEKVKVGPTEQIKKEEKKEYTADDMINSFKDFKQILTHVIGLHKIVRKFLKKVTVEKLSWSTTIGLDDAAHTGLATGAIWAIKGSIVGFLSKLMRFPHYPSISVIPEFNQWKNETKFICIFHFRIGHAIFAGMKIYKYWVGGKPIFQSRTLSKIAQNNTNSV